MDPNDSIDGLGMVVADLSELGWRKALVRVMHRTEAAQQAAALDDETRAAVIAHLKSRAVKDERVEQVLRAAIGRPEAPTA